MFWESFFVVIQDHGRGAGLRGKEPVVKVGGWRPLWCVGDTRQAPRPVGVWGNLTRGLVPPALWVVRELD